MPGRRSPGCGAVRLGDVEPELHLLALGGDALGEGDVAYVGDAGAAAHQQREDDVVRGNGAGEWSGSSSTSASASDTCSVVRRAATMMTTSPDAGGDDEDEADLATGLVEGPAGDEDDGGDDLPEQPPRRQLDRQPGGEEARAEQDAAAPWEPGVEHVKRAEDPDDEQGGGHGPILPSDPVAAASRNENLF